MLAEFGAQAFYDAFSQDNTEENIRLYLEKTYSPEIQQRELENPAVLFFVAEIDSTTVGYAKLSLNSRNASIRGANTIEIERIYAAREHIGKGVGRELIQACIHEARERGCDSIWLGVWEKNPRAIAFYTKWGFEEVGSHVFMLGNDPQRDFIMELRLQ